MDPASPLADAGGDLATDIGSGAANVSLPCDEALDGWWSIALCDRRRFASRVIRIGLVAQLVRAHA